LTQTTKSLFGPIRLL